MHQFLSCDIYLPAVRLYKRRKYSEQTVFSIYTRRAHTLTRADGTKKRRIKKSRHSLYDNVVLVQCATSIYFQSNKFSYANIDWPIGPNLLPKSPIQIRNGQKRIFCWCSNGRDKFAKKSKNCT